MRRFGLTLVLTSACLWFIAPRLGAPLVYRPGEGWVYELPGETGTWRRDRAKDQYEVALDACNAKQYKLALRAALRTVQLWPLSDYAPDAQYLVGFCYEALGRYEKAFDHYQKLLEKYPKFSRYDEVVRRQFEIANRFLAGQRFRVLGLVPLYRSMDRVAEMYVKVIGNAPESTIAPLAQLNIGVARERQKDYELAAEAYAKVTERYSGRPLYAAEALFREAMAYYRESLSAEYDQSAASKAIERFTDFTILYPNDPRAKEAKELIFRLRVEQAKGALQIARFYEKRKNWVAARIYYNEVLVKAPESAYADEARQKLEKLRELTSKTAQPAKSTK